MLACFLLGSVFTYNLLMGVYRLHIHPLSRFPGPRLAAVTGLYEIYLTAWRDGSFEHEIRRLHREYGPVVRITPDEVHVQEQPMSLADCWDKGAADGEVREKQRPRDRSTRTQQHQQRPFFIRKRRVSPVRCLLLRVEVDSPPCDSNAKTPGAPGVQLHVSVHAEARSPSQSPEQARLSTNYLIRPAVVK